LGNLRPVAFSHLDRPIFNTTDTVPIVYKAAISNNNIQLAFVLCNVPLCAYIKMLYC